MDPDRVRRRRRRGPVKSIDRLARNTRDLLAIVDELAAKGVGGGACRHAALERHGEGGAGDAHDLRRFRAAGA